MKVVSFFSFKGGVGRTALMVNVGAHWVRKGYTVLLIDMDLFAPGLTYHKCKGAYLHPEGAGLGISDLLSAFAKRDENTDEIPFLPPRLLIREMNVSRQKLLNTAGRMLMIDAGASVPEIQKAGGLSGVCGAYKSGGFMPEIPSGDEQNGESLAYRNLAEYIRRDLESAELPPREKGEEPGKIDYVLIDCRTGFPELLDLSLGYLADDMVILSGLNDQNLAGLKETVQALNKRVEIGALPGTVTVVFSPVPAAEDEAVLESLKNAHDTLRKALRFDKYGISESPPNTHVIHYTPVLAMRDDVIITLDRPESMYAREASAIADDIQGATAPTNFEDAALKKARLEVFSFLEGEKPAVPVEKGDREILESNPLSLLPPWWWPIADLPIETRKEILAEKMPAGDGVSGDREALLNKLSHCVSLTKDEKTNVMAAFQRLTDQQIRELHYILDYEKRHYMVLWKNNPKQRTNMVKLYFGYQKEWKELIAGSRKEGDAIFLDAPFEGRGMFEAWEKVPVYWVLLGRESVVSERGEQRLFDSIEKAFSIVKPEERTPLAVDAVGIFAEGMMKPSLLEKAQDRILEICDRHVRVLFEVASRRIKQSEGRDENAMADVRRVIDVLKKEKSNDSIFCFSVGAFILDHARQFVPDCEYVLKIAADLDPKYAAPWNSLGILYKDHLGRYEESEMAYSKAIELDPKYASPWNGLGNLYKTHLGRYEESERAYRKAIELDPKYAYPWNNLGNLYKTHLGRYEESERAYRKAIELDPKDAYPWNGLGNLYKDRLGRYEESESAYRKAIELDPKDAYPWNGLGNLYKDRLGRYEESESAYRKAIELDPKYAYPWNGLGQLYEDHLGRYEESESAYRKAIELDPKYASPWNGLAILYQTKLNRIEDAKEAYQKAIEANPEYMDAYHNDAEFALVEKDFARAKSRLLEAEGKLKNDKERRNQYMLQMALSIALEERESLVEIHGKLLEINPLIGSPSTWNYEDMKPLLDTLPEAARRLFQAWVRAVKREPGGIDPEAAFQAYLKE